MLKEKCEWSIQDQQNGYSKNFKSKILKSCHPTSATLSYYLSGVHSSNFTNNFLIKKTNGLLLAASSSLTSLALSGPLIHIDIPNAVVRLGCFWILGPHALEIFPSSNANDFLVSLLSSLYLYLHSSFCPVESSLVFLAFVSPHIFLGFIYLTTESLYVLITFTLAPSPTISGKLPICMSVSLTHFLFFKSPSVRSYLWQSMWISLSALLCLA